MVRDFRDVHVGSVSFRRHDTRKFRRVIGRHDVRHLVIDELIWLGNLRHRIRREKRNDWNDNRHGHQRGESDKDLLAEVTIAPLHLLTGTSLQLAALRTFAGAWASLARARATLTLALPGTLTRALAWPLHLGSTLLLRRTLSLRGPLTLRGAPTSPRTFTRGERVGVLRLTRTIPSAWRLVILTQRAVSPNRQQLVRDLAQARTAQCHAFGHRAVDCSHFTRYSCEFVPCEPTSSYLIHGILVPHLTHHLLVTWPLLVGHFVVT